MHVKTCTYTHRQNNHAEQLSLVAQWVACLATSQFAFSVKALFPWVHGFEFLSSHTLTKFCILGYQGIPQPSRVKACPPSTPMDGKVGSAGVGVAVCVNYTEHKVNIPPGWK